MYARRGLCEDVAAKNLFADETFKLSTSNGGKKKTLKALLANMDIQWGALR